MLPCAALSPDPTPVSAWTARARLHLERVSPWADAFLARRSHGQKHPVEDFLFTYYPFSPNRLKQWMPGLGERIEVDGTVLKQHPQLSAKRCIVQDGVMQLDPAAMEDATLRVASLIVSICEGVLQRAPRFRCYGLHEWAMVYRQSADQVRHQGYELRLPAAELAQLVETQPVVCSHFDAFRFFAPEARVFNTLQPTLETRPQMEQGGCLHANMDIYKWAYKLWPWCGSDLVGEAFALAQRGRQMDMRASPYDLRHLGYEPIPIETPAGREVYEAEQRSLAAAAVPVRERLLAAARRCLHSQANHEPPAHPSV